MIEIPPPEIIDANIASLENGSSLSEYERSAISVFLQTAKEIGDNVIIRIVGGWVRDKILGLDPNDIDLAVENITGDEYGKKLQLHFPSNSSKYQTIIEYEGQPSCLWVARCFIFDDKEIDVCRLRAEEIPDEPPKIEQGTPFEDSIGRDFTVNSIFFNLNSMKVEDFSNGIADMKNGVLRTGVDAIQKFAFEMKSIIRAFRFSVCFPFKMCNEIEKAIRLLKERYIEKAPKKSCNIELFKCFRNKNNALDVLKLIAKLEFFDAIFDPNGKLNINIGNVIKDIEKNLNNISGDIIINFLKNIYYENYIVDSASTITAINSAQFPNDVETKLIDILINIL